MGIAIGFLIQLAIHKNQNVNGEAIQLLSSAEAAPTEDGCQIWQGPGSGLLSAVNDLYRQGYRVQGFVNVSSGGYALLMCK